MTKIPVTIVTGFLGSGKTTLISHLMKKNPDRRLAVLVNEFGETSVDGAMLRNEGEECGVEIHDLPNGCICCTVKDDFLPVMRRLQERKHEVDHVLIETSGLALATPVTRALGWPEVRNDFGLDAVLAVVDTPELLKGSLEEGNPVPGASEATADALTHSSSIETILNQQLESADVVVLNKIDDYGEEELGQAEERIREKATQLRFLELAYGAELDTRLCMGLNLHETEPTPAAHDHDHHHGPVQTMPASDQPLADQEQFDGHRHSGLGPHEHGEGSHEHFHEHDMGWQSFVLHCHEPQDGEQLKQALRKATHEQPILRAKGFARVVGKENRLVVQAVRTRVQTYYDQKPPDGEASSIVFIGYHPSRKDVARTLSEMTEARWE